jgi:hypothetical protein
MNKIRGATAAYLTALIAIVTVFVVLILDESLSSITYFFEINYNEGWNVYNAARMINHELIYDGNYWRVNNYPIGSFLLVAAVNLIVNDLLLSGRIIALLSFVAVGFLAAVATRRFGGDLVDAEFGGGCAFAFCYLIAPAWVAVDDPQTLGEAVMLGGLVSYFAGSPERRALFRTALFIVLALFVKHNLVAIPIVITLDLAIRSPRLLPIWLAYCTGLVTGFLGVTELLAGGAFIDHLLSPRIFSWHGSRYHLMKYLRLFKFPLLGIVLSARPLFSGRRFFLAAWGITSIALATLLSGFEGTSYNMFQDAAVFLGVASGVLLSELRKLRIENANIRDPLAKLTAVVLPILVTQPVWARLPETLVKLVHPSRIFELNHQAERTFLADARYISARGGSAFCESLLLCYAAGQPFILDPFNSRQYILAGRLDEGELIQRIAAHEFATIQVRADICDDPATTQCHILHYPQKVNRFTDNILYAIDLYYRIDRRSRYGAFYVPR